MKLTFRIFGVEITTLELELPEPAPTLATAPVVARGVKWISNKWLQGMTK